jgi:hypothetical protein
VAVQLGIDAKKSDQVVRGAVVMPNGTGKTKRVAVFAQGAKAEEAKAAGADIVGMEDLAAEIKAGNLNFDVVIASPDTMRIVGTLGQILGPRGLMPNPKVGTVTPDVATAVRNAKAGQVQFRVDKAGIIHGTIGRRSFDTTSWGNLRCAAGGPDQGQAGNQQGHLPAQGGGVVDHGRRRAGRRSRCRRPDRLPDANGLPDGGPARQHPGACLAPASDLVGWRRQRPRPSKTAGGAARRLNQNPGRGPVVDGQRRWRSRLKGKGPGV